MASRRGGGKHHEEEGASEAWLLPYSDLMTLLLAVFIVLFAVSKVDTDKLKAVSDAFKGVFNTSGSSIIEGGTSIMEGGITIIPPITTDTGTSNNNTSTNSNINTNIDTGINNNNNTVNNNTGTGENEWFSTADLENLEILQSELQTYFTYTDLEDAIFTTIDERGLVISLNNSILFDSGSSDIKPEYADILIGIGESINKLDNYIRVEGHTDNAYISTALYPSNWELSCARSARVVRLLIDDVHITPDRLVSVGYGEFRPVADNNTAEGRAQNRRVDIIILNSKFDSLEGQ